MWNVLRFLRCLACCGTVALAATSMVRQAVATPGGAAFKTSFYADLSNDPYLYFPSAEEKDARFVAIVGNGLASLGDQKLSTKLAVPRTASQLEVGVFDGDTGGLWDVGTTPITFTLYADPLNNGAATQMIRQWSSTQMADNAWTTLTVPLSDFQNLAQGPSGHYFFNLVIASTDPAATSLNAFKLRARGTVALRPTAFSVTAQVRLADEIKIVYPNYPTSPEPNSYDGLWNFFMDVPSAPDAFEVWDGDLDYGAADGSTVDTADPDTGSSPLVVSQTSSTGVVKQIPTWSNPNFVNTEGAKGKGNPTDDQTNVYLKRAPSVEYDIIDANGVIYTNANPSGTEEWERFRIDTRPMDRTQMDYHAESLGAGIYQLRVRGLDVSNLISLKLDYDALGVSRDGLPGKPLRAFQLGDTVWYDGNGDGLWQNNDNGVAEAGEEPPVPGVVINLVDGSGNVVETTQTDANGHYNFEVDNGDYIVEVAPVNFVEGGVLHGLLSTTGGDVVSGTINNASDFSYDFGYHPRSGLSSCVWLDANGDGEVDAGEPGISGVTVRLYRVDPVQGLVFAGTTATNSTGTFGFSDLTTGTYEMQVDPATLPFGLVATTDADGLSTLNSARAVVVDGQVTDVPCFGYTGIGSIGDKVWCDDNQNGQQDASDPGIGGVRITLKSAQINGEITTDGTGYYSFNGLPVGTYTVEVDTRTLPLNRVFVLDRDGVLTPGSTVVALGGSTMNVDDADFGYCGTGRIGDTVWLDSNRNGVQDPGENGIPGVAVYIMADLTGDGSPDYFRTKTTDSEGKYLFTNLFIGDYTVSVDAAPLGLEATYDLDGISTLDTTAVVLGVFSTVNLDADFGYVVRPSSVGDRVWLDTNLDGAQDTGELGIAGATVSLLNESGSPVATATTDADGYYLFEGQAAGNYTIAVTGVPAGLSQSYDLDGVATADQAAFTLGPGEERRDVDFGYGYSGSVGDTVWLDADLNGAQNGGETGISGATVTLKDGNGDVVATATTGADGKYLFTRLAPGSYVVTVSGLPAGAVQTYDLDGIASANAATFTLGVGEAKLDVDFGYGQPSSAGDRVWLDANRNGVQDSDEAGISGVTVKLLDASGAALATKTTDSNGLYLFDQLVAGDYSVVVTPPASLTQTYDLDGLSTAHKASFTLAAGEAKLDVDFGYGAPPAPVLASVGDRVWRDSNLNGVQDTGEPGIAGVTVTLKKAYTTVATTTTNVNGEYLFNNLSSGTYTVYVSAPSGLSETYDLDGLSTGDRASFYLSSGEAKRDVDFGYGALGSIGDKVWLDSDLDGVQDSGEGGLGCVTVRLYTSSGTYLTSTTTNSSGYYLFSSLPAGNYLVVVSGVSSSLSPTYDLDGISTAGKALVTLSGGQNRVDVDFGYGPVCSVGDRVWLDADGDGCQDSSEAGISGVTVKLLNSSGSVIATTTTDANGKYLFDNLAPGSYSVTVSGIPSGYTQTYDLDGTSSRDKAAFTLSSGDDRRDVDFGYKPGSNSTGGYTTYTQGGWGTSPRGNNPGTLLKNNFSRVFPCGVKVGGRYTLTFTSASAVEAFLPQGGTANKLTCSATNPTSSSSGVLGGQVLSMQLSLSFSDAGVTKKGLGSLRLQSGKFAGYTLSSFCSLANKVLGGDLSCLPAGATIADVNDAATKVNENFDNGTTDKGFLR